MLPIGQIKRTSAVKGKRIIVYKVPRQHHKAKCLSVDKELGDSSLVITLYNNKINWEIKW